MRQNGLWADRKEWHPEYIQRPRHITKSIIVRRRLAELRARSRVPPRPSVADPHVEATDPDTPASGIVQGATASLQIPPNAPSVVAQDTQELSSVSTGPPLEPRPDWQTPAAGSPMSAAEASGDVGTDAPGFTGGALPPVAQATMRSSGQVSSQSTSTQLNAFEILGSFSPSYNARAQHGGALTEANLEQWLSQISATDEIIQARTEAYARQQAELAVDVDIETTLYEWVSASGHGGVGEGQAGELDTAADTPAALQPSIYLTVGTYFWVSVAFLVFFAFWMACIMPSTLLITFNVHIVFT
ncbi:hypothetical protein PENSPDRAFT_695611 [Peniophora sp. CONT]|nr:hypothetical protein PENSPDRAFT_695611 [Peniophora sp. CONT]